MREVEACYNNHQEKIQRAVGKIEFIALTGHVCTNYEPNDYEDWKDLGWEEVSYPMIPNLWKIKPINESFKIKTIRNIEAIQAGYDGIIVGTDSDVEGYGIYDNLETYLSLQNKPALRFLEHSLTDEEILKSLLTMTDYHTDPVHERFVKSFRLRSRADWLYGMNGTREATNQFGELFTIGRVKAPTLKLVYDNSLAIADFKPESYYSLDAFYESENYYFQATYVDERKKPICFKNQTEIQIPSLEGEVTEINEKEIKKHAPQLYDLSAIQTEAGVKFGYSPEETLAIVQSLYEKHKAISYPRTQCRYVSKERAKGFQKLLPLMNLYPDLKEAVAYVPKGALEALLKDTKVVNDKEVIKESHDALLPTELEPDLSLFKEEENNLYHLILARLLAQFLPALIEVKTELVLTHDSCQFLASGSAIKELGWKMLYQSPKEVILPRLSKGDTMIASEIKPMSHTTKPPKRLTQATLLRAMENVASQIADPELRKSLADSKGIGTPATRATIISDLLKRNYMEEKKKALYITEAGARYICAIQEINLTSPVFAARLDTKIKAIQRGEARYEDVYEEILTGVKEMTDTILSMEKRYPTTGVVCPDCNVPFQITRYYYICPDCGFRVPKSIAGASITEEILAELINTGRTQKLVFTKKDKETGEKKTFEAHLALDEENDIHFVFTSDILCPECGKNMTLNRGGLFCECGMKIFRKQFGKELTDGQLKELAENRKTKKIDGFISKEGNEYSARLQLQEDGRVGFLIYECPRCKAAMRTNRGGAFCKECGVKIFRKQFGKELTDEQFEKLVTQGNSGKISGFEKKSGEKYNATLVFDDDFNVTFDKNKKKYKEKIW